MSLLLVEGGKQKPTTTYQTGRSEPKTKNRNRQRENRRMKDAKIEKPWLNHEGYHDPTAYQALRKIERREAKGAAKTQ